MQKVKLPHPDLEKLSAFGLGRLDDAESAEIEEHLVYCDGCRAQVETVPADSLVGLLQTGADTDTVQPTWSSPSGSAKASASDSAAVLPPDLAVHPRYHLLGVVGSGGMGTVFKAQHRLMERPVALKVISSKLVSDADAVERFHREIKAAARLAHPNIVAAYDAEQAGATHFLVMEFVAGTSLASLVKKGPLPVASACAYVREAALGLQHAFENGMVHRDIKPQNLMLTDKGMVKILDFGLSRFMSESGPAGALTQAGAVMGTPDYMAPEQAGDAHAADIRADIYGLGCTLYHLLAGQKPFPDGSVIQKLAAHLQQTPTPLRKVRPEVPSPLERVVEKMMAKEPGQRYQTPAEVTEALAPFLKQAEAPPSRPRRLRRWLMTAAAAVAIFFAGVSVYRIVTDEGELEIRTDDRDVKVVIEQGGKLVTIVDLKTKQKLTLRSGAYEVRLGEGKNGLRLSPGKITMTRGGEKILRIIRAEPTPHPTIAEYLKQAQAAIDKREFPRAVAAATEAVRRDEKCGQAYVLRFRANAGLHRLDDVLADCAKAIDLDAKEIETYVLQSWAYLNKNAYPECVATANKGLDLHTKSPHISDLYANRGCALADLGHYALALADYNEAIRLSSQPAWELLWRGLVHEKLGNPAQAKADRDRALKLDPTIKDRQAGLAEPPNLSPPGEPVGRELRRFQGTKQINSVDLSSDGRLALSGDVDNTFRLWDVATGRELYRFPGHREHVWCVAFSPDGRLALSAGGQIIDAQGIAQPGSDFEIRLWDVATRKELRRLRGHTKIVRSAVFSPNSKQVLSARDDGVARLWDVETGAPIHKFVCNYLQGGWVLFDVAFSPDGSKALAAGGVDQVMYLWDLQSGKELHQFKGHTGLVRSVAFSADGTQALSGSWDKSMCLWDLTSKKKLKAFSQHLTAVNSVAFANKGRWAIACTGGVVEGNRLIRLGGPDCAVHIYDTATGKEIQCLEGHTFDVLRVAVARDGRHILSGSNDGTMRWWRLPEVKGD